MANPRLPCGAYLRLGAAAIAFTAMLSRAVLADESVRWPCGSMGEAKQIARALGGADFVTLTSDQWQFLRGIFVMAPDTPESLPPGDRAAMSLLPDGSGSVIFVDGDRACAPIKLGREAIEALMMVGRGDIVHAGQGL
jgi:hypothetical protein